MHDYLNLLQDQLAAYHAKCSPEEPLPALELLWQCYFQTDPVDDGRIKQIECKMAPAFEALKFDDSCDAFLMIGDLVDAYRRAAFLEGIRIGISLQDTVSPQTQKSTP